MIYKHTQVGYLMIYVLIAVALLFGFVSIQDDVAMFAKIFMVLVVAILASFTTLTVEIDNQFLRFKFGFGLFRKKFALDQIESVKAVKHKWYYGWGIRFCLVPRLWIYNVSGFDAVEITLKNGSAFRIGTDEPEKLVRSIKPR